MASAGGNGSDPEFQVAPMIDVLLVLLVFFMSITTEQVLNIDRSINLPVAPDAKKREHDVQNEVIVNVDWDNPNARAIVRLGAVVCEPLEQLEEFVKPMIEANPKLKMIIRSDSDTPSLEVQRVIEQLALAGIDDISLSGTNRSNP